MCPGWFWLLSGEGPPGNQDHIKAGRGGLAPFCATKRKTSQGRSLKHSSVWEIIFRGGPKAE